jgi:cell division septation protein DedD
MQEIKEQRTLTFEEDNQLPEEVNKYHKRIDDLIEDAEIEAEMEAAKKIRSKNSRMFSISMIGLSLLAMVYFQVNYETAVSIIQPIKEILPKKFKTTEDRLDKQVPLKNKSNKVSMPILPSEDTTILSKNLFSTKSTGKINTGSDNLKELNKTILKKNKSTSSKSKTFAKQLTSVAINKNSNFFIQAGAFGIKKNADTLFKQLKDKGFSPSIKIRSQKSNRHIIFIGNFPDKNSGDKTLKKLIIKGFKASYNKTSRNSFNLNVGEFNNLKDAQKAQKNLKLKGFISTLHEMSIPVKTYIVQLGVFSSLEKARLTQKKLTGSGFSNTFVR